MFKDGGGPILGVGSRCQNMSNKPVRHYELGVFSSTLKTLNLAFSQKIPVALNKSFLLIFESPKSDGKCDMKMKFLGEIDVLAGKWRVWRENGGLGAFPLIRVFFGSLNHPNRLINDETMTNFIYLTLRCLVAMVKKRTDRQTDTHTHACT